MKFLTIVMCVLTYRTYVVQAQTREDFIKALLTEYDSRIPPNFEKDVPCAVNVSMYINSIDSINEQTMDFTLSTFVSQRWLDTRLKFLGLIDAPYLELDARLIEYVWVPDLYFRNEKTAHFHTVTIPNKMIHIYQDGTVDYKSRLTLTASCPMKLHKYPMDDQTCSLIIQSFAYSTKRLTFQWRIENPVVMNPECELPQFTLSNMVTDNCTGQREGSTCIQLDMYLKRNIGFYMIQLYIPSILIVMLSWLSFWLHVDAVPARSTCIQLDMYLKRNIGFYMIQLYIPSILIVMLSWLSFWLHVDSVPARSTCIQLDMYLKRNIGFYMIQLYIPSILIVMLSWLSFWLHVDAVPARSTCIQLDMYLKRNIGFYMIQLYIPSILIVMLSWLSFWLHVDAVPARVSLGILTVLTMTTQRSMATASLPRVSYVKAIDVWMAVCLCFVFAALLEYACVNVLARSTNTKLQQLANIHKNGMEFLDKRSPVDSSVVMDLAHASLVGLRPALFIEESGTASSPMKVVDRSQLVDNMSRLAFPAVFILFCMVYALGYGLVN